MSLEQLKKEAEERFIDKFNWFFLNQENESLKNTKTPIDIIAWHNKELERAYELGRQQTLEEAIANLPEEKYSKTEGTEDWDMVGGFNDCRTQTLSNLQALKDKNK